MDRDLLFAIVGIVFGAIVLTFFVVLLFKELNKTTPSETSSPAPPPPSEPRVRSAGEIKYEQIRAEQRAGLRPNLKESIIKLGKAYQNLSPEEQQRAIQMVKPIAQPIANILNTIIPSTVVTAGSFVVTYRNITFKFTPEEIKGKLTDVVDANPNVDIKKLQGPLGIQIIDVQGSRNRSTGDIYS